jgi:hypothetical protein
MREGEVYMKNFSFQLDAESWHRIAETAALNGVSKSMIMRDFVKTCLAIVDESGQYLKDVELKSLLKLVDMPATKTNVYRFNQLLHDFGLIKALQDTLEDDR